MSENKTFSDLTSMLSGVSGRDIYMAMSAEQRETAFCLHLVDVVLVDMHSIFPSEKAETLKGAAIRYVYMDGRKPEQCYWENITQCVYAERAISALKSREGSGR